jgi:hypothetical protein
MPTALSDPSSTLYAILVIIFFVLAALWFRNRTRGNFIRLLIAACALVGLFVIDQLFESPREEATRKIHEMAQASQDKNWNALFSNISDSFTYKGPGGGQFDKETFRKLTKSIESIPGFNGVVVWDFHPADFRPIDTDNVKIGFRAKLKDVPNPEYVGWIVATFHRDPDGQWRMSGFNRYDPVKQDRNDNPPLDIPGFN